MNPREGCSAPARRIHLGALFAEALKIRERVKNVETLVPVLNAIAAGSKVHAKWLKTHNELVWLS